MFYIYAFISAPSPFYPAQRNCYCSFLQSTLVIHVEGVFICANRSYFYFRLVRTYINEIYFCVLSYAKIADSCSFFFLQTAFLRFIRLLFHLLCKKKSAYISASTLFVYKAVYSLVFVMLSRFSSQNVSRETFYSSRKLSSKASMRSFRSASSSASTCAKPLAFVLTCSG